MTETKSSWDENIKICRTKIYLTAPGRSTPDAANNARQKKLDFVVGPNDAFWSWCFAVLNYDSFWIPRTIFPAPVSLGRAVPISKGRSAERFFRIFWQPNVVEARILDWPLSVLEQARQETLKHFVVSAGVFARALASDSLGRIKSLLSPRPLPFKNLLFLLFLNYYSFSHMAVAYLGQGLWGFADGKSSWRSGGGGGGFRTKPRIEIEFVWTHAHCSYVKTALNPCDVRANGDETWSRPALPIYDRDRSRSKA